MNLTFEQEEAIEFGVIAALGCTEVDCSSPKKLTRAARQIVRFVCEHLEKVETATDTPSFGPGQTFLNACLAVDLNCNAWWVDPDAKSIIRVTK